MFVLTRDHKPVFHGYGRTPHDLHRLQDLSKRCRMWTSDYSWVVAFQVFWTYTYSGRDTWHSCRASQLPSTWERSQYSGRVYLPTLTLRRKEKMYASL